MKLLITFGDQDIDSDAPVIDTKDFRTREAARAVLLGDQGAVFLLKVNLHDYHKLPGGGVEMGEDIQTALKRELMEEVGCRANVTAELGMIVEYRGEWKLKQISYCFLASQIGIKSAPSFDTEELAAEFSEAKASSIDDAIRLIEADHGTDYESKFIRKRDLVILHAAKSLI